MANISQTIRNAKDLGIAVTNADLASEMCAAWVARVALAQSLFDRGEMVACQAAIDDANRYAI